MQKSILFIDTNEKLKPRRQLFFRTLREHGYKVSCIMWDRGCELPEIEEVDGIIIKRTQVKANYRDVSASLRVVNVYIEMFRKILKENCDVIHCGHFALLPLAVIGGKLRRAKVVYDVSEFFSMDFFRRLPKILRPLEKMADRIEGFLVKKVDGVICVPSYKNLYFKRYTRHNNNVQVIMNVPDVNTGNPCREKVKQLKEKYAGKRIIIYSGGLLEQRGAFTILEVLAILQDRFPNILLLYIGYKVGDIFRSLQETINKLGLTHSVEFIGYVPYNELQNCFSIGDVAVSLHHPVRNYSLLSKGNGRKFGDYMRAGLPIVASDFREISMIVKEEDCGILVDPLDASKIANVICYLFENPHVSERLGENGRKAVMKRYNWEREKKKLLEFYKKVL